MLPKKTGGTLLLSPPLLVLGAGKPQIFKLFFISYRMCTLIALFGVVSCLFAYLCLYLLFQILSRTSLGCSFFRPVRPISSFSTVVEKLIVENDYDARTYGPIKFQE